MWRRGIWNRTNGRNTIYTNPSTPPTFEFSVLFLSLFFFFSFFFSLFIFGCLFTFSPRIISAKKKEPENKLVCREHISGVSKIGFDVLFRTVLKQYQSLSH